VTFIHYLQSIVALFCWI